MSWEKTCTRIFGSLLLWIAALSTLEAGPFRASCVKVDITPQDSVWMMAYGTRRSEGVHDPLFHRIVALDDGSTRFVLVSTDVTAISPALHDRVENDLQEETGLRRDQIWWTATHTHSSPVLGTVGLLEVMRPQWVDRYGHHPNPEYSDWAVRRLVEGIKEALSSLKPARLGIGTGQSLANINRRPLDLEGKAFFGKNPDGPVDHQIGLIRLEQEDGSPLALIVNYSMHGTVLGGKNLNLISGDAPGIVVDAWDHYQRGLWHYWRWTRDDAKEAERLLNATINLDPEFSPAHAVMANGILYVLTSEAELVALR